MSRLQRAFQLLPQEEAAEPLSAPTYTSILGTKSVGIQNHQNLMRTITSEEVCAYSDGSSEGPERSSWGYVLQRRGTTFQKGHGVLHGREVYDAEIFDATIALRAALSASQTT